MNFTDMMTIYEREPDSFVGRGPSYPWGGLFGGQIVAQSLRAATATVDPEYRIHSLHAYFIRKGEASEPIRFDVDRLRNGRSFVTRAVVARQSGGAILHMSASFQSGPAAPYHQTSPMPSVADPESFTDNSWSPMFDRRFISEGGGEALAWLRLSDAEGDPVLAACALAFLSDDLATDAVRSRQQAIDASVGRAWNGISLDHAIWFHHYDSGGAWQLHHFRCEGVGIPRGLAVGQVYSDEGTHLATVAQEVLLRAAT